MEDKILKIVTDCISAQIHLDIVDANIAKEKAQYAYSILTGTNKNLDYLIENNYKDLAISIIKREIEEGYTDKETLLNDDSGMEHYMKEWVEEL